MVVGCQNINLVSVMIIFVSQEADIPVKEGVRQPVTC